MSHRISVLVRSYLLTVILFVLAKVVFIAVNGTGQQLSVWDVAQVIGHGLSLDLSTALYFMIVPFLFTLASIWVTVPRWLSRIYYGVVAVAFSLTFVSDTSLYPFWHFKLDASCLQYLETPTEAMASVSAGYMVLRILAVVLVAVGIYGAYGASGAYRTKANKANGAYRANGANRANVVSSFMETAGYLLLIPIIIVGIRGGLNESTTNVGQVYFSPNQFLNHSAVNPVFSFLSSFEKTASYIPDYHFVPDEECRQTIDALYPTESVNIDTLLTTQRPNIVVILMESCGGLFTMLEGREDVMPHLNRLMHESISFDRCYGNSWRTDRGTLCTFSGYPSFPTSSVMKMPSKTRLMPNIANSLAAAGYETSYIYGGDINFTNMRSYLVSGGFNRLTWLNDYSREEQKTSQWGVRDDITFQTLIKQIEQSTSPFLIGFSTLSSHEPWDVPLHQFDNEILNAFYYLDDCIGRFVNQMRQTPAWKNLLVILLPDHSIDFDGVDEYDVRRNHIPMVWTGGAVKAPKHIATICNQTDLAATLLGQLGLRHDDFRYSRDVMSSNYTEHFAVHTFNNGISMIDSTGFAVFDIDLDRMVVNKGTEGERLVRTGKAILQSAAENLKGMR